MKFLMIAILSLVILPLDKTFANANKPSTNQRMVSVNDAFIPSSFDSGSDGFMVVNGIFPNSCYHMNDAKVSHVEPLLHEVSMWATVSEGMCIMALVPYTKEVQMGILAVGDHDNLR